MRVSERAGEVRNHQVAGTADGIPFIYAPGSTVRSDLFVVRRWREGRGYFRTLLEFHRLKARHSLDCVFLVDGGCDKWHLSVYLLLRWLRFLGVPVIAELNEFPRMQRWVPPRLSVQFSHLAGIDGAVAISRWLSEWAAGEARRIGHEIDIIEIPIVVDSREQAAVSRPDDGQLFVYSASSGYDRDLAFVLKCMRRIWGRFPQAELMVTGMRPQSVALVVEGEGVQHAVDDGRLRIRGYLERSALLAAYQHAAGLLIPLHDDLRSRARFPSKIGEYLVSGRPVVTTRVGEVERFLRDGDTAFIAVPDDVAAFSDKMAAVLEDPARADLIGASGRRRAVEMFSHVPQGIRLKRFMERICSASTASVGSRG
jgi:glycosyltransferase involved in cell wall biosynthesis